MTSPRAVRAAAMLALCAMLFAKAALAVAACLMEGGVSAQQAAAGCHEAPAHQTLCAAHCQEGAQTLDKHQVKLPPALSGDFLPAIQPRLPAIASIPVPRRMAVIAAGPPPRILFQSFLI